MSDNAAARNNARKLTLEWVQDPDGSRALVFDVKTWAVFERAANDKGKTAPQEISTAVATCLGPTRLDRKLTPVWVQQRDGSRALVFDRETWAAFQRAADAQDKTAPHVISVAVTG